MDKNNAFNRSIFGLFIKCSLQRLIVDQMAIAGHQVINDSFIDKIGTIIVGFVVLVLAEVFKVGLQLQQEKELTI
ncbi:hypothetical protein [Pontibacter silvestris]